MSEITPTNPAEIDLKTLRQHRHFPTIDVRPLIAAVEVLREQVAELIRERDLTSICTVDKGEVQEVYERAEAAEAHAVELAGVLEPLREACFQADMMGELYETIDGSLLDAADKALATTPPQALERAIAAEAVITAYRGYAVGGYCGSGQVDVCLATLDALNPADKTLEKPAG